MKHIVFALILSTCMIGYTASYSQDSTKAAGKDSKGMKKEWKGKHHKAMKKDMKAEKKDEKAK